VLKYISKRILAGIPIVVVVGILVFFIIHLIPGNPAEVMLGSDATPEDVQILTKKMGLDQPIIIQFGKWFLSVLQGNLGDSIYYNSPVANVLAEKMEPTIIIIVYAMIVALLIGIPAGVVSAIKRNKLLDRLCMGITMLGMSMPAFLLGLLLIMIFSLSLGVFPAVGYRGIEEVGLLKAVFVYLTLPSMTLGLQRAAGIARVTRSAMLDVLGEDYIRTARAKGLKEYRVVMLHALKNAMAPILTQIGFSIAQLAAGAVVIETIFNIAGIGQVAYFALLRRDYPLIQGYILGIAVVYVAINTAIDILYKFFDPRVDIE
jgi:peptide/nickel transport system permease protein